MSGTDPNWVIAAASIINVIVLIVYAISTQGIRKETKRQAELTAEVAKQSRDALRLQVLIAYQEEVRAGRTTSRSMAGVALLESVFAMAFPDTWKELRTMMDQAAEDYKRRMACD